MNLLLFLSLILGAFAQDFSEILYYKGRSLGSTPAQQIAKTQEILQLVKQATDQQGVATEIRSLKDRQGNSYPVMIVLAQNGSELNLEAARVARQMGNLPLIFSPYDLGRSGAAAFFDPDGSKLGVSYDYILGDKLDPSYVHELYHATTYLNVLSGKSTLWAGLMRVTKGSYMSSTNQQYYNRFAALDEIVATALSLKLDGLRLLELKRISTPQEFNKAHGAAYALLGEVYLSAKAGYYLAKQAKDLAERALKTTAQATATPLKLGQVGKSLPTTLTLLDSFSWEVVNGRGTTVAQSLGTEFKLYWPTSPTPAAHQARLTEIIRRAAQAEMAFNEAGKCIYVLIEYPDLAKTDYNCLAAKAPVAFGLLDR